MNDLRDRFFDIAIMGLMGALSIMGISCAICVGYLIIKIVIWGG